MIYLKIIDAKKNPKLSKSGVVIEAVYESTYIEGDFIQIEAKDAPYLALQINDTMKECFVYIPDGKYVFPIPFGDKARCYPPEAWSKATNTIRVRKASEDEFYSYRNIALNTASVRYDETCFPYAKANVVTRDEPWFEERNSIDGVTENCSHGAYPYQSYAGGAREDIDYCLYFGKEVEFDKLVFYLRADFAQEHDTYWKSFTAELSDGTQLPLTFIKTGEAQEFKFSRPFKTKFIHLTKFKQASTPLSWAALTQIEVYGNYIK